MTRSELGSGPSGMRAVFEGGAGAGRTDGQLLEAFATAAGDASERAFGALVARHGGMVLRACRGVLGHDADARDAFQAVFLALARRGGALRVRESVGPWLHRVAVRESARLRRRAERRAAVERRAGLAAEREVRYRATEILGGCQPDGSQPWHAAAVDGLLDVLDDPDPETRRDAIRYGVGRGLMDFRKDEIIRAVLTVARRDPVPETFEWVTFKLQDDRDATIRILDESLRGPEAEATRAVYRALVDHDPPAAGPTAPADARAGYVAAFRGLFDELKAKYPMFALKRIDWDQVGRDLMPRVEAAQSQDEFGLLVEELVARLEDSHAAVLPGTATPPRPPAPVFPEWGAGIACLVDDRDNLVVYEVPVGTPAHRAGVRPGMMVINVNGANAGEAFRAWMERQRRYAGYSSDRALRYDAARQFLRQPKRGDPVALTLEDGDGRTFSVALAADDRGGSIRRLPVARPGIDDGQGDVQAVRLDDGIGYLMVRRIRGGLEVGINQALTALEGYTGLIVDVRGNSGGGFDTATAFRNFDPAAPADPGLVRYAGPIALLIDERCISAGEGWASWFVANHRARLFGSTTAGASSRKETYELSNGLYKVTFSVKAYTGFLDRPIERLGLVPDVPVRCTARDLAAGRDTVAEAAVAWLKEARGK